MNKAPGITYRDAGVDIDAGDALVDRIKPLVKRTQRPEVLAGIGGFGALVELPAGYKRPVLVSGTDGVGTKLRLAIDTGRHGTIGIVGASQCLFKAIEIITQLSYVQSTQQNHLLNIQSSNFNVIHHYFRNLDPFKNDGDTSETRYLLGELTYCKLN